MAKPKMVKVRDLNLRYAVVNRRQRCVIPKGGRLEGRKLFERRRLKPREAGKLAHGGILRGTAAQIHVNLGVEARGLGRSKGMRQRINKIRKRKPNLP